MAHQALYSFGTIAWSSALVQAWKVRSEVERNVEIRHPVILQVPPSDERLEIFSLLVDMQHRNLQFGKSNSPNKPARRPGKPARLNF